MKYLFWFCVIVVIAFVSLLAYVGFSSSRQNIPTGSASPAKASLTPIPSTDLIKQFQAFKTEQGCVVEKVKPDTIVFQFSQEGATTSAKTREVFLCKGMHVIF